MFCPSSMQRAQDREVEIDFLNGNCLPSGKQDKLFYWKALLNLLILLLLDLEILLLFHLRTLTIPSLILHTYPFRVP